MEIRYKLNITPHEVPIIYIAQPPVALTSISISYSTPELYVQGNTISPNIPVVVGFIESYSVFPDLPAGLTLNTYTGVITGTPTQGEIA